MPSRGASVLRDYIVLSSATIASQGLTFVAIAYLARVLGVATFGDVALAQAIVLYFKLLSDLGLEMLGTKQVAADREAARVAVGRFLAWRSVHAAVAMALLLGLLALVPGTTRLEWLLALYALSLVPTAWLLEWAHVGLERMAPVAASRLLSAGVNAALVFAVVRSSREVAAVPIAYAAGLAASAIMLLVLFGRRHGWPVLSARADWWRGAVGQALPMGLAFITIQVYYSFGTLFLGLMEDSRAVGLYAAPQKVVLFLAGLAALFGTALYPRLVTLWHEGARPGFERLMGGAVRTTILAAIPIAVGGTLLARPLVVALFGEAYVEGIPAFQLMIWSIVTIFGNAPFAYALLATDRQKQYLAAVAAGAAVNVLCNLLLIPRLHLAGAALATLCSEVVVFVLLYRSARAVTAVRVARAAWPALAASAVMAAALAVLGGVPFPAHVAAGAAAYVIALAALGGVTLDDVAVLREAIGRR